VTRAAAVALLVVAVACRSSRDAKREENRERAKAAAVPGVETAVVGTETVRDSVRAFAVVAADVAPAEVRDAVTQLAQAEAKRRLAEQQVHRLEDLARGAVAPQKELEAARADAATATAEVERARKVLAAVGGDAAAAPALGPGDAWVIAQVAQTDVGAIVPGVEGRFVPEAFAERAFPARVDAAPAYVDPTSRTAPARLRVADPDRLLRPGMTGTASLDVGAARAAVVVPVSAVVYDDAQPVVFVAEGDERYSLRQVRLGVAHGDGIEVASGLEAGARVAITGAASLLSATRLPPEPD